MPTQHDDEVNSPSHYTHGGIETWDFIKAKLTVQELRAVCIANVIKYSSRGPFKHAGREALDYKKARWYLDRLIETYE